jgi:hypothetical protein
MVGNLVHVTATWTAGAAVVDSKLDSAERTRTFGHEPDGLLGIIGERLFPGQRGAMLDL